VVTTAELGAEFAADNFFNIAEGPWLHRPLLELLLQQLRQKLQQL